MVAIAIIVVSSNEQAQYSKNGLSFVAANQVSGSDVRSDVLQKSNFPEKSPFR